MATMSDEKPAGSVTQWIKEVKDGESNAAQQLWDRYFEKLVGLANRKLHLAPRQEADEEDVAIQALTSFFDKAKRGRFPRLQDRCDLWSLLASITEHKAQKQYARHRALKRGGGQKRVDMDLNVELVDPNFNTLDQLSLELRDLLHGLKDDRLRQIVVLILYGHTNAEIALEMGISERTVERKRLIVRRRWATEFDD